MTYEEEQAEYARFAEEERARNEAIAAEAARLNAEAEAAAATLPEEPVPSGADVASANEAFEAETARRRAEFEAEEARRRAEFEANQSGEAELGERLDESRSANETATFETEWMATSPEPNPLEDASDEASFLESETFFAEAPAWFEETDADGPFESETFETFAEAPAANPDDLNPENSAVPDADSPDSSDLPFPYSLEAATETVAPSEKEAILRAATHALGPALRETAAQALEAYAKRLREEADEASFDAFEESFSFPDASFASGEAVAEAIDESFEEAAVSAYGANDGNATTAFPRSSAFPEDGETVFVEEPTTVEPPTEAPTEAFAFAGIEADADVPEFEEIEVPTPPPTTEDEAGFFEDAFAFAPEPAESFEEYAFAPAPAEAVPQEGGDEETPREAEDGEEASGLGGSRFQGLREGRGS